MINVIIEWLGEPPNDMILNLYYVLAIVIVIYFTKMIFSVLRAMLGIRGDRIR